MAEKKYIERDAAILAINNVPEGNWSNKRYVAELQAIPVADVVEVVRCRECIFRDHYKELYGTKISICTGAMAYICTPNDWYCANGKRKDGGQRE